MSNKATHTWVDNRCTVCGVVITKKSYKMLQKGKYKHFKQTVYKMGSFVSPILPKCKQQTTIKRVPLKQKPKKVTGERALNLEIWEERPHVDYVTGFDLPDEPKPIYFIHVLGKGAYPAFRLYKKNIVLGSADTHYQYDFQTTEDDPRFDKLNALKEELKEEYNKLHKFINTIPEPPKINRRIKNQI
jgi:hypothetical protein